MKIGDRLKEIRLSKNISQKNLAQVLNIPVSTLANYENNHREPKIEVLEKIAQTLDVSMNTLLNYKRFDLDKIKEDNDVQILIPFNKLNSKGQKKAIEYLTDLCKLEEYTEKITDFCNTITEIANIIKDTDN